VGIVSNLIDGLGTLLADAGAVTWAPNGVWTAGAPPLFDTMYPDQPDVAACLATYYLGGDEPTLSASVVNLQVKTRSSVDSPRAGTDLDDAIAQVMLGNWPVDLGTGVTVSIIERTSGTPLGRDGAGRHERVTNYRLTIHDPGPYRG
jgi:hypothetical protein